MEAEVLRFARVDPPVHRAKEEIAAIAEADLGIGVTERNSRKAAEIGYDDIARAIRISAAMDLAGEIVFGDDFGLVKSTRRLMMPAYPLSSEKSRNRDGRLARAVARIVLKIDPDTKYARAKRRYDTHMMPTSLALPIRRMSCLSAKPHREIHERSGIPEIVALVLIDAAIHRAKELVDAIAEAEFGVLITERQSGRRTQIRHRHTARTIMRTAMCVMGGVVENPI
jgi:hypothetical protein